MKENFQGGDNFLATDLYSQVFDYIEEGNKVLNLGCGKVFVFENEMAKTKKVFITSCDILPLQKKEIPTYIEKYIHQSVEELFSSNENFDIVTFFELIEHIDKTDILLKNCFNNLKSDGLLIFSFPNLSSIYARLELLLGYQPHILEISNECSNFGTGIFGKYNNSKGKTIHHLRGIVHLAMKEMVEYHGFSIEKTIGFDHRFKKLFHYFPSIAPVNIFICRKK